MYCNQSETGGLGMRLCLESSGITSNHLLTHIFTCRYAKPYRPCWLWAAVPVRVSGREAERNQEHQQESQQPGHCHHGPCQQGGWRLRVSLQLLVYIVKQACVGFVILLWCGKVVHKECKEIKTTEIPETSLKDIGLFWSVLSTIYCVEGGSPSFPLCPQFPQHFFFT